jgi:Protein of unknown function (DUF4089)
MSDSIAEFVDLMAAVVQLPIPPEDREGVIENFVRIAAIAQGVNEFPIPDDIEAAPVFRP